jgi:PiT family inorganic phosphate transporter
MVVAWLVTLPAAGAVGAASYGFTRIFGTGASGPLIAFSLAILLGLWLFVRRLRQVQPVPSG